MSEGVYLAFSFFLALFLLNFFSFFLLFFSRGCASEGARRGKIACVRAGAYACMRAQSDWLKGDTAAVAFEEPLSLYMIESAKHAQKNSVFRTTEQSEAKRAKKA